MADNCLPFEQNPYQTGQKSFDQNCGAVTMPAICTFLRQPECIDWEEQVCWCETKPLCPDENNPVCNEPAPEPCEIDGSCGGEIVRGGNGPMRDWMAIADPMAGQMTYTLVAITSAAMIGLDIFRYNLSSGRYDGWTNISSDAGFNFWKNGTEIGRWSGLVFWSIAALL